MPARRTLALVDVDVAVGAGESLSALTGGGAAFAVVPARGPVLAGAAHGARVVVVVLVLTVGPGKLGRANAQVGVVAAGAAVQAG
jgi:hypothetical protein